MNDRDWDDFFELLENITNMARAHTEKRDEVRAEAKHRNAETALDEFVSWFNDK